MSTFALVHGAWHGAWCWERLVPELEALGHRAVAVDLPCDDISTDASAYARVVAASIEEDDDVVLVGHSLGGITIPLVAASRPLRRLVFLCALLPVPGRAMQEQFAEDPEIFSSGFGSSILRDELNRSYWGDLEAAAEWLYGDCSDELAASAISRLRPQARAPVDETCPLETWPGVACSYVVCSEDRAINPAWSRRVARDRLGVDPIELAGSHSPFLSRPAELAALLHGL